MKSVFVSQQNPSYDDLPGVRYHFPRRYLRAVQASVGDSIVYYESGRIPGQSKRAGRMAYFGVARVTSVEADNSTPDHYYARLDCYLPFTSLVPLRDNGQLIESSLQSELRAVSGLAQSAVRPISEAEFEIILRRGFATSDEPPPPSKNEIPGLAEPPLTIERPCSLLIYERPFRDRVFSSQIMSAYDKKCAITGLRLVNGGGRAEAQAAHIVPVAENGPDMVQNGLSLSGTVHWMFDRGLISLDDDLRILKARNQVPAELDQLINRTGYLLPPAQTNLRPHSKFLRWHRENRFKG